MLLPINPAAPVTKILMREKKGMHLLDLVKSEEVIHKIYNTNSAF